MHGASPGREPHERPGRHRSQHTARSFGAWPGFPTRARCADGYLVLGLYPGQDDPEYRLPTHTIHRMWARGNARVVGFFTGAVVGAAAGGGLAAVRSDVCFRGTPPAYSTCHGNIAADAFIGGAVGGLLGWVLGRGLPHWTRIIP